MIISAIVAAATNNVIGKDNDIPWHLPADLKYFKRTTLNHHIIMGRNCFESIGRPLPKRTNIVVTRQPFYVATGCIIAHSIEEALEIAATNGETEAFIIGGGQIYEQSQLFWDKVYKTIVHEEIDGDVYFPTLKADQWIVESEEVHQADEKNPHNYTFQVLNLKDAKQKVIVPNVY